MPVHGSADELVRIGGDIESDVDHRLSVLQHVDSF
jgi:hypothetical protein